MANPKNTLYPNFVLENEIEDLFASRLDLQPFVTVDNALVGAPGMIIKVNRYTATDATQVVAIGEGNTQSIVASYTPETYTIKTVQNRFEFYDEELMTDEVAIQTGIQKMAAGMFDKMNADITAEWALASQNVYGLGTDPFAAFVDAQALINKESLEPGEGTFAIIGTNDLATVRKKLGDNLKFVEAFSRQGYIGSVAGTPIYIKKNLPAGKAYMATREAVKLFVKKGTEVEVIDNTRRDAADANVRLNTMFSRKCYVAALVDDTKVVCMNVGAQAAGGNG